MKISEHALDYLLCGLGGALGATVTNWVYPGYPMGSELQHSLLRMGFCTGLIVKAVYQVWPKLSFLGACLWVPGFLLSVGANFPTMFFGHRSKVLDSIFHIGIGILLIATAAELYSLYKKFRCKMLGKQ